MDRIDLSKLKGMGGGAPPPGAFRALGAGGALMGIGYGLYNSVYNVEAGRRAILFNRFGMGFGAKGIDPAQPIIREGTHFALPWFQRPIIYDCRTRPNTFTSLTGSKDLQMVNITIRVLTKPIQEELGKCYDFLGNDKDMDHRVLPSIVPEVLKATVAKYNAAALVTKRDEISREIRLTLEQRLHDVFYMTLEDVSLVNISFGPEYTAAVERKQIAQQEAERAKYKVEQAKQEKRSVIVRAQGEAEASRKINEAMQNNPGFLELRRVEKAREIAHVVAKSPNRVYLDTDVLMFNMGSEALERMGAAEKKTR
jgi:prohibitin 2|eukprot:COSAG06_NODE_9169_length_1968_cov_36.979133_2_plen_311_part_00